MMKRMLALALCVIFALSALSVTAFAEDVTEYTIYVTIADGEGHIVVPDQPISVGGVAEGTGLSIYTALRIAHDNWYEGGADAGFEAKVTEQYGTSLEKLWGVKNGGAYGYYVNNKPAYSLDDILHSGDHLYAWVYQDTKTYSDKYCYFENAYDTYEVPAAQPFTGTLYAVEFDENWQPVSVPLAGVSITDYGEDTGVVTDENGQFTLVFEPRSHMLSAKSDKLTLVPPRMLLFADYPYVSVTIADGEGNLQVRQRNVILVDNNNDGKLTIEDALYTAHYAYEGGPDEGFEVKKTEQYGTSLEKLWGVKNGGAYGYYVNNRPAYSLDDELKDGDQVYAWIYQDAKTWKDQYAYFEESFKEITAGDSIEVKLMGVYFDEMWMPYSAPIEGAVITVDGEETSCVTDKDGVASLKIITSGGHTVSAKSEKAILTPPAMTVEVSTLLGDADSDGYVTVIDATTIQKYKASILAEDEIDLYASDVDEDGYVTVLDATRIQKYKAKICELDGTPIGNE